MNPYAMLKQLCAESPAFASLHQESQLHLSNMGQALPRVVVCGLLKAGKSTLLNALTNHLEQEYFATRATRATVAVAELAFDEVVYVDTPGLDANAADDEQAWRGLVSADQLLFVHNMRVGTFDIQEMAFLRQLQQHHPALLSRMIVVLTHAESAQEGQDERLASFRAALDELLPICPPMALCSWPRFHKGVSENKPALLKHSGFPELKQLLASQLAIQAHARMVLRQKRQEQYQQQMHDLILLAIQQRQTTFMALEQARRVREKNLYQDFAAIVRALHASMAHYLGI